MIAAFLSAVLVVAGRPADDLARVEALLAALLDRVAHLEERIEALEDENARLRERIAELEGDAAEQADDDDGSAADRVMQVTRIEAAPIDETKIAQAEALEKQAAEVEKRAAALERQRAEIPAGTSVMRPNEARNRQQRRELATQISRHHADARRLRGQARALRREAEARRPIVHGWDGERIVILEMQSDYSAVLSRIGAGGFARWRGRLIGFDEDGERYSATWIGEAGRPAEFQEME